MALKKVIELGTGVTLSESYIKIIKMEFYYVLSIPSVKIITAVYKDQAAYDGSKLDVVQFSHVCSDDVFNTYFSDVVLNGTDVNHRAKAYVWLKTLSEYSGAVDV